MRPLVSALLLLLAACSSTGDGGTQPGPTPAIAISLSASSASIAQGGSTTVDVTITRSGGFTGTVNVTVTGAPAGVSGSVGAASTNAGVTTATVTVSAAASTAPGTYTLTVQGSGSGVSSVSTTYTLTVTAAAGYSLGATPGTLSMAQGGTGTVTIDISRTGFAGNVALAAEGLPAGVTASFAPNPAGGTSSTLTLTATAGATAGTGTVTIRGTAAGLTDRTTTVSLTITVATSSAVVLDFGNCGTLLGFPVWLAYQDGNGPWTRVIGTANVYRFNLSQSRGGVAYTTGSGVSILYQTRAEFSSGNIQMCEPVGPKRINGSVAGVGAGNFTWVSLGNSTAPGPVNTNFTIDRVRSGPQDLVAYRITQATPRVGERAVILRDLDIATNGSTGVIDFNGANGFDPITATVSVTNLAGDDHLTSQMNYYTTAGCALAILHGRQNLTSPFTTAGIPPARQRPTDFHVLMVTGDSPTLGTRGVQHSSNLLANRTVTLPPAMPVPTVTVLAGPFRRLQATTTISAEYDSHTQFAYWQGVGQLPMTMLATAGWIGGTAVTLAFPDLSGVAGWNAAWAPPAGATGSWNMMTVGKTMGFAGNLCVEGGATKTAMRNGTH